MGKATETARESLWRPSYIPINWCKPPMVTDRTRNDVIFEGYGAIKWWQSKSTAKIEK